MATVASAEPLEGQSEAALGAGASSRLDEGTKLGSPCERTEGRHGWTTTAYPTAGEAVCYVPARQTGRKRRRTVEVGLLGAGFATTVRVQVRDGQREQDVWVPAPERTEEELKECMSRAGRRAKTKVRRYCRANVLDRLWTLTFANENLPPTRADVMREAAEFVRRLRKHLGHSVAYVVVPERGTKGTQRFHLHLAIGFYISKPVMAELWGLGWVDARRFEDQGGDQRTSASKVAHYVAKYVEKTFEEVAAADRQPGEHRYECGQGFQPESIQVEDQAEEADAFASAIALVGDGMPTWCWSSESVEKWPGPPVRILRWGG